MTLTEMLATVRRDLHDEDDTDYRWTDDELKRHIAHAIKDFSQELPLEETEEIETTAGEREIDISSLTDRVRIEGVEYPAEGFPQKWQRFMTWKDTLTLVGPEIPDGSTCRIYYGKLHTLDEDGSTIPARYEELIAEGACGYAACEWAVYAINKVNTGGEDTPIAMREWGNERLQHFRQRLKKLGRKNLLRVSQLYAPYYPIVSQSKDWGPG